MTELQHHLLHWPKGRSVTSLAIAMDIYSGSKTPFNLPAASSLQAVIDARNVFLQFDPLLARHTNVVKLFNQPHPPQLGYNKIYQPTQDSKTPQRKQASKNENNSTIPKNRYIEIVARNKYSKLQLLSIDQGNT